MANLIKIKRSSSTAAPASLNEGELAFSFLTGKLFIGNSSAVIPIGGTHDPGLLTANQALVANATLGIDRVLVANLSVLQELRANNSAGTAGHLLASAGVGANAYWIDPATLTTSAAGANTQIQFNNSGAFAGDAAFTWDTATDVMTVGNSTVNVAVNSSVVSVGSNVKIESARLFVGNSTVNAVINSTAIDIDGSITSGNVDITGFINVSSTANVGGNITARGDVTVNGALTVANTAALGNTTITGFANVVGDFTAHGNVALGNSFGVDVVSIVATVNTEITPSANNTQKLGRADLRWGEVNANNVLATNVAINTVLTLGSNVTVNSSALFIGNSTVNAVLTSSNLDIDGTVTAIGGAFGDVSISGNLIVSGTLTTIDTVNLTIKDPLIKLANNNLADSVDIGLYGVYVDGSTKYTAFFRDQSDSGKYKLYTGLTNEPGTTVDLTGGALGALVVGALEATSLTLTNPLAVGSGGTGAGTFTSKGVLYGNATGALQVTAAGTDGQVLQANSTGFPVFADLDGGTF